MILELRDLLRRHGQIPLRELSAELHIDPETTRTMLRRFIKQGQVEKLPEGTLCAGGCRLCPAEHIEIYRWIGENGQSELQSHQGISSCTH